MTILEINAEDNSAIEREATAEEVAQRKLDEAYSLAKQAAEEEKAAVKQAVLDKLGLSEDELKAVLG